MRARIEGPREWPASVPSSAAACSVEALDARRAVGRLPADGAAVLSLVLSAELNHDWTTGLHPISVRIKSDAGRSPLRTGGLDLGARQGLP